MIVIDKTPGKKIPYEIIGNSIFFNDEIMFNLEKYERDFEQNIDICEDENFSLANGLGRRYVAQIVIPARRYEAVEAESEEKPTSEAVPFDISKCTLILWGLE